MTHTIDICVWRPARPGSDDALALQAHARAFRAALEEYGWRIDTLRVDGVDVEWGPDRPLTVEAARQEAARMLQEWR